MLAETKVLLAKLQASMLCGQVAEYAAHHRICPQCGVLQPLKDRRTRWLQTLFGTVEVEAPRFKVCRCRLTMPMAGRMLFSPVNALLTARCTPELERVQAELGARTSFRDAARITDRKAVHVLSAFASDAAPILAHQELGGAPDEIAAVPKLMAELGVGSVRNLGRYAASWIAGWPNRPSSTAALT